MRGEDVVFGTRCPWDIDAKREMLIELCRFRCLSFDVLVETRLKRAPFDGGAEVELRQVFESEDFGEAFTPELREQEERLRAQSVANAQR